MKRLREEPEIRVRVVGTPEQVRECQKRAIEILMRRMQNEDKRPAADPTDHQAATVIKTI